ncbi:MAG TPA: Tm-1-like ATP-binding domain-containing protein [Syntrophorhabdus sp.]|jgi:uncharacterized protein (UPF0261 family)|nr:Tm-1-like ATP-binding domain-containing protein [Syntrophorhabdus sp.]HOH26121.1 Tm-1-like ATP-binding domain-containing protein [Syntrophorhabdus sp.]
MKKQLLIIATLDTKGRETEFVRNCAQTLGVNPIIMDIGVLGDPPIAPDISKMDLAAATGVNLPDLIQKKDRAKSVQAMEDGGAILAQRLRNEGKLDGIIGLGGGTGTAIVSSIMRTLPFGLPKVIVSTVASRDIRQFIGTKDIVMFHSVADLLGFNEFIRLILKQATHAVCGMIEGTSALGKDKPMIGVTAYGINSGVALNAEPFLVSKGYEMLGFHANGCGGMAMEELVAEGRIAGVLDFNPHEIADEMFGGYCKGIGPSRLETAGRMGIPLVFAPGGLDNAVFSPVYPMPESLKGRRIHGHDTRFCVRMEQEEMKAFARIIADKLNKSKGFTHVLIPLKGWSDADKEGAALYDPSIDEVFTKTLKELLLPHVPIEEIDLHISDPNFALRAVDILHAMIQQKITQGE